MDLVHPLLLLLRGPFRRFLCPRDAPSTRGGAARRGGGAPWFLRELRGSPGVSGAPHRRPRCELVEVLAHAHQRHPRRSGPELQVLVADVGGRVGAAGVWHFFVRLRVRIVRARPARPRHRGRSRPSDGRGPGPSLQRRRWHPRPAARVLYGCAPQRQQPADLERYVDARRIVSRLCTAPKLRSVLAASTRRTGTSRSWSSCCSSPFSSRSSRRARPD